MSIKESFLGTSAFIDRINSAVATEKHDWTTYKIGQIEQTSSQNKQSKFTHEHGHPWFKDSHKLHINEHWKLAYPNQIKTLESSTY